MSSLPSNGITADVFRDAMPPYHLSPDLVAATFAALPPPPPDADPTWRQARVARLLREIVALHPANAAQARLAAQMLVLRERADTLATESYAPEVTAERMCRLSRTSAELVRTAALLDRTLARHQQKPVPFFGTVVEDAVDVAAVAAAWGKAAGRDEAVAAVGTSESGGAEVADQTEVAVPEAAAALPTAVPPVPSGTVRPADRTSHPVPDADSRAGPPGPWATTRLEEGPGWALDFVGPRPVVARGTEATSGAHRSAGSRGWPAGPCPRAGLRPDPGAGHDTGEDSAVDTDAASGAVA